MKSEVKNCLAIRDPPEHRELDCESMRVVKGGRINLDIDAQEKGDEKGGKILHAEWVWF